MIDFCIKIAEYQNKRGRYFIIENPQTSRIWYTKSFQGLLKQCDVDWDTLHMCAFGMKDPKGYYYYYYKPTSLMFNIPRDVTQVILRLALTAVAVSSRINMKLSWEMFQATDKDLSLRKSIRTDSAKH